MQVIISAILWPEGLLFLLIPQTVIWENKCNSQRLWGGGLLRQLPVRVWPQAVCLKYKIIFLSVQCGGKKTFDSTLMSKCNYILSNLASPVTYTNLSRAAALGTPCWRAAVKPSGVILTMARGGAEKCCDGSVLATACKCPKDSDSAFVLEHRNDYVNIQLQFQSKHF